MTKEIHEINSKCVDFVAELIEYIFTYPDDDYMTMECLCRKLVKYGLIDNVDHRYEPKCEMCKWNTWDNNCMVEYRGCSFKAKAEQTEPSTDCGWK